MTFEQQRVVRMMGCRAFSPVVQGRAIQCKLSDICASCIEDLMGVHVPMCLEDLKPEEVDDDGDK